MQQCQFITCRLVTPLLDTIHCWHLKTTATCKTSEHITFAAVNTAIWGSLNKNCQFNIYRSFFISYLSNVPLKINRNWITNSITGPKESAGYFVIRKSDLLNTDYCVGWCLSEKKLSYRESFKTYCLVLNLLGLWYNAACSYTAYQM